MHGTPPNTDRGGHAHRDTQQLLIAVSGRFEVELSDGGKSKSFSFTDPNRGLFMPPMIWVRLYDFSEQAVCLVLADTQYNRSRSIRTWEEFLLETERRRDE